jgi:hypothetical protein
MVNNELNVKLHVTEDNIEHLLNSLEQYSGLEVKDIGLMRNEKGKLQVIILMWRGKGAKAKED